MKLSAAERGRVASVSAQKAQLLRQVIETRPEAAAREHVVSAAVDRLVIAVVAAVVHDMY